MQNDTYRGAENFYLLFNNEKKFHDESLVVSHLAGLHFVEDLHLRSYVRIITQDWNIFVYKLLHL